MKQGILNLEKKSISAMKGNKEFENLLKANNTLVNYSIDPQPTISKKYVMVTVELDNGEQWTLSISQLKI